MAAEPLEPPGSPQNVDMMAEAGLAVFEQRQRDVADDTPRHANRDALGQFGQGNNVGVTFAPGTSGNPDGAPKHKVELTRLLGERLQQTGEDGRTWAQRVTEKLVAMADAGNMEALKYLVDRIEGKPTQAVSLSLDDGPLHHRLNVVDGGPRPRALPPGDTLPTPTPDVDTHA